MRLKALKLANDEKYNIPERHFQGQKSLVSRLPEEKRLWHNKSPDDYEEKIIRFHRSIIDHRKEHNFPVNLIVDMDEMPLAFDMPPNQTGEKTVKICTTGNEKIEQQLCWPAVEAVPN